MGKSFVLKFELRLLKIVDPLYHSPIIKFPKSYNDKMKKSFIFFIENAILHVKLIKK